jgi:hypothetical protein
MLNGHSMYAIHFPTADESWLYDGSLGVWTRLESDGGRHWSNRGLNAFDKVLVSDYSDGTIYELRSDELTDNGDVIARELVSDHVRLPSGERFTVHCLRLDMEVGVGTATGQGSDPQLMLQISKDGGKTWGNEIWKTIGAQGEYRTRVEFRRMGQARTFTFKLRITDPVQVTFISAALNPAD